MKFDHILIASDIDGTILWEAGYINPKNLEALRYFTDNGGHFALATGRNHMDVFAILHDLAPYINMPCILCNGSYLFDTETRDFLNARYLPKEPMMALLTRIRSEFAGRAGFRASFRDGFMVANDDSYILEELKGYRLEKLAIIRPFSAFAEEDFFKSVFIAPPETLCEIRKICETEFSEHFTFTTSAPHIFEVQPKGVSKDYQFPYLKARYHDAKVWAIGDFNNDLEMLRGADVAVCPENAVPEVKAIADHMVCHCKNGALAEMITLIEKSL